MSENCSRLQHYEYKDYLISAHWGSTTTSDSTREGDKCESGSGRVTSKEADSDCLHKYKTFKFTEPTTHWQTMKPPPTATYRIVNPNPYCKQYHAIDKSKKHKPKDIPLDIPVIIQTRNVI
ncbi:uncharacterized protein LOC111057950 isoform X2 [Nilaparvata lugens]|uniref:uncharacterized protein LOC111057950 isoform X2 n=1 Tax=Nilaparvata lugens TaxID=108931 RepID=UPI00193E10CD|nr:uncharacterized protein LOC111057950 isoform X2 [Nilaparvata lugens]